MPINTLVDMACAYSYIDPAIGRDQRILPGPRVRHGERLHLLRVPFLNFC